MNTKRVSRPGFQAPFGLVVGHSVLIVVMLGLLGTSLGFLFTRAVIRRDESRRFQMARQQVEMLVQSRVDRFVNVLRHTRAFLGTAERVSRRDFQLFFQNVDLRRSYPGLQGVAYVEKLPTKNLAAHEREAREDGIKDYRVWPHPQASIAYPVKFVEPFDVRNQRALGFDMLTEPHRREAMERARDTGEAILSKKVTLQQESAHDVQPGFLLFLPVYKRGWRTDSPEQRRRAFLGLVSCPFRAQDFFAEMYSSNVLFREGLAIEVYDGTEARSENLLFADSFFLPEKNRKPEKSEHKSFSHIQVGGHDWTLLVFSTPRFSSRTDHYAPLVVMLFGVLVTILVTWVVFMTGRQASFQRERAANEQNAREDLESLADDLNDAVKERDRGLAQQTQMLHVAQVVSAELEVEKVVQVITDAATKLSKARIGAFFYAVTDEKGESLVLYSLAGIARGHFKDFSMPRSTEIFPGTFAGGTALLSDDITKDPHRGRNSPFRGIPEDRFLVRSYLEVPVISRSGETLGGIFLGHDEAEVFTEREENVVKGLAAQAAIAIDNARLFQKNREAIDTRDEFLSICSHELRTPLTSLKLQNQLVQRSLAQEVPALDKNRFSKLVLQSGSQIDRLVRLVEEMLDISRIRSGKLSITPERLDLTALTGETLERFAAQLNAQKCLVEMRAPPELTGVWDRLRLEQVLVNLLTNAMKYGQGRPIRIELSRQANSAMLAVQDHGIGIAKEHQGRIFERFERAVSKSEISGLGLGLYIVKQILELHGGSIRVESELGRGSRFVVELPLNFLQVKVIPTAHTPPH